MTIINCIRNPLIMYTGRFQFALAGFNKLKLAGIYDPLRHLYPHDNFGNQYRALNKVLQFL